MRALTYLTLDTFKMHQAISLSGARSRRFSPCEDQATKVRRRTRVGTPGRNPSCMEMSIAAIVIAK